MLEKLADKMKVSYDRMPNNVVENFGNSGSVTIPTLIAFNLGQRLAHGQLQVCLAGFGGGLTWATMLLKLNNLNLNTLIEYK